MKLLLIALTISSAFALECPKNTLVKKIGANTHYSQDFKNKWTSKELAKFGCVPDSKVMSKEQNIALIDAEAAARKSKL